jgi:hypothetical protein
MQLRLVQMLDKIINQNNQLLLDIMQETLMVENIQFILVHKQVLLVFMKQLKIKFLLDVNQVVYIKMTGQLRLVVYPEI